MNKAIKRLINAKRRKGLAYYAHGVQIALPNIETGEHKKITFQGEFDRKKLRRMLRKALEGSYTTVQLDWIIDHYSTKLRPLTHEELTAMYEDAA